MPYVDKHKPPFCDEFPTDCSFERKSYPAGATVNNEDMNINYLIFCQSGHARITSTLFHDEILCAGEVMFVPHGSEYSSVALSDVSLLVHKFNNMVCRIEKCIEAVYVIWIVIISRAGVRKKASTWTCATSMKIRPFQPDTTASLHGLWQWKYCMPF